MLTLAWSDGVSFAPLDFSLRASMDPAKRLGAETKVVDGRSCAGRRRKEALTKSTEVLEIMVERVLRYGFTEKIRDTPRFFWKIVLIGGETLAELMIDHNVGESTIATYDLKKIDSDYFTED